MKLLLIQGANLNSLGRREGNTYDSTTAEALDALLRRHATDWGYELEIFYTNIEGEAVNKVYASVEQGVDGILSNPAGFTYNAYSLRDCLKYVAPPYVELHLTNIDERNIPSALSSAAVGVVHGFGINSYFIALEAMLRHLKHERYQDH
ncbi:type II 3-dehydroquinate dehydratase [Thiothrix nivea]|uniref:3-dehydroquinate dehydratase n=1 Tax=Thiothrix nivea (strain ATCC 35100 / DSM 5205 / JP2) TaxID=870187 RepID=A0A656HN82_THINJ|nr:type II 3-dehydroquinate dehydratase [Thiothrix nivea]EIJ36810.1 3-dehydroquinate dehydratase [Thiothrix nivea DSM 5205]